MTTEHSTSGACPPVLAVAIGAAVGVVLGSWTLNAYEGLATWQRVTALMGYGLCSALSTSWAMDVVDSTRRSENLLHLDRLALSIFTLMFVDIAVIGA